MSQGGHSSEAALSVNFMTTCVPIIVSWNDYEGLHLCNFSRWVVWYDLLFIGTMANTNLLASESIISIEYFSHFLELLNIQNDLSAWIITTTTHAIHALPTQQTIANKCRANGVTMLIVCTHSDFKHRWQNYKNPQGFQKNRRTLCSHLFKCSKFRTSQNIPEGREAESC